MPDTARIRALNDSFRTSLKGGRVMMTRGIAGRPDCAEILEKVRRFDAFTHNNDPYGEHDFGALEAGRDSVFWKIDYYNKNLSAGSEDPADPDITERVMILMLAEDW